MRRRLLALAVAALGCGSTPIAPSGDPTPFDFSFADPTGDTLIVAPFPIDAGPAADLIGVSGTVGPDEIRLVLGFGGPIALWSAGAPNSIDGFVDFDLDQNPGTGLPDAKQPTPPSFGLGVEYYLDLRDDGKGHVALVDAVKKSFILVPVSIAGIGMTITIPRTAFGPDDGEFAMGVLIGDRDRTTTDFGPDTGHYSVARP